jgi:hypothetical protein
MQDGSSAGAAANAAAVQQMMAASGAGGPGGGPRQLPLPYLVSSLCQFTEPLRYPDHAMAMDVRELEREAILAVKKASSGSGSGSAADARLAKDLVRQLRGRLLQLRQSNRNKDRMAQSFKNATLAGGKVGSRIGLAMVLVTSLGGTA